MHSAKSLRELNVYKWWRHYFYLFLVGGSFFTIGLGSRVNSGFLDSLRKVPSNGYSLQQAGDWTSRNVAGNIGKYIYKRASSM